MTGSTQLETNSPRCSYLPNLDLERYSTSMRETGAPFVNFVTASKRQMVQAYEMTSPQAKRFFDKNITSAGVTDSKPALAPIQNKTIRHRPSVHSFQAKNKMLTKEYDVMNTLQTDTEICASAAATNFPNKKMPEQDFLLQVPVQTNNLINQASKMSVGFSSAEINTMNRSPSSKSVFSSDCRQLQQWIDGREMQFFSQTEEKTQPDELSQINSELEQIYFSASSQILTQIPKKHSQIEFVLQRTIKGLHTCFIKQQEFTKKTVETFTQQKNDAIEEMKKAQSKYDDYIKYHSVEAYFKKFQFLIDRHDYTKTEKQKHELLVKNVDEFLDSNFIDQNIMSIKQNLPTFESSGAENLLLQLQMISKNIEVPRLTRRPEAEEAFELKKKSFMKSVLKDMHDEAGKQRRAMEKHIRKQLQFQKPFADAETNTLTFEEIEEVLIDDYVRAERMKNQKKQDEIDNKKFAAYEKEIRDLEIQIIVKTKLIKDQRMQLMRQDVAGQIAVINKIIEEYFRNHLGSKALEKIVELQHMIEDITLTEEEREQKSKIRAQKRKQIEDEKQLILEKERLVRKAEREALKVKQLKKEKKQSSIQVSKEASIQSSRASSKLKKRNEALDESLDAQQPLEGEEPENVYQNDIKKSEEQLFAKSASNSENSQRKSIQRAQSEDSIKSSEISNNPLDVPQTVSIPQSKQSQRFKQLPQIIQEDAESLKSAVISQKNRSQQSSRQKESLNQQTEFNIQYLGIQKENGEETYKEVIASQQAIGQFDCTEKDMINQIKSISELAQSIKAYEGLTNINQDIAKLEGLFEDLKNMPIQVQTLTQIFNSGKESDRSVELSLKSRRVNQKMSQFASDPLIQEARLLQDKLKQIREVQMIIDKTEKFIKTSDEASQHTPIEQMIEVFAEVKRAQNINKSQEQLLPSQESLQNLDKLFEKIAKLKIKVKKVLDSKFKILDLVIQTPRTGERFEKIIDDVNDARFELLNFVLTDESLIQAIQSAQKEGEDPVSILIDKGYAPETKLIKMLKQMDKIAQCMLDIKRSGLEYVEEMEYKRLEEEERKRKDQALKDEKDQKEAFDKAIHQAKASAKKKGLEKTKIQQPLSPQKNQSVSPQKHQTSMATSDSQKLVDKKASVKTDIHVQDHNHDQNDRQKTYHGSQPSTTKLSSKQQANSRKSSGPDFQQPGPPSQRVQTFSKNSRPSSRAAESDERILEQEQQSDEQDTKVEQKRDSNSQQSQVQKNIISEEQDPLGAVERQQVFRRRPQDQVKIQQMQIIDSEVDAQEQTQNTKISVGGTKMQVKNKIGENQDMENQQKKQNERIVIGEITYKYEQSCTSHNDTGSFINTGQAESPLHLPRLSVKIPVGDSQGQTNQQNFDPSQPTVYINNRLQPKDQPRKKMSLGRTPLQAELLRSSIPETDYRKTGSEFSPLHPQEQKLINQVIQANLNKKAIQKNDVSVHASLKKITADKNQNLTQPSLRINEDIEVMTNIIRSIGSDSMEDQNEYTYEENLGGFGNKKYFDTQQRIDFPQIIANQPQIYGVGNQGQDFTIKPRIPKDQVLMLPQQTQTENRSFLKYLLNLINQTLTKHIQEQLINKDQQKAAIEQFQNVIPEVYESIKDEAESMFVKEPSIQYLPVYDYSASNQRSKASVGIQAFNSQSRLSPSYSGNLQIQSQLRFAENGSQTRTKASLSPQRSDGSTSPQKKKPIQFLQLSDFSRYGTHTLDIKKEIQQRITVKHIGMVGGGFAGHRQK